MSLRPLLPVLPDPPQPPLAQPPLVPGTLERGVAGGRAANPAFITEGERSLTPHSRKCSPTQLVVKEWG